MFVDFLYTNMMREPLGPVDTSVSMKGMVPGCLGDSVVNWI